MKMKVSKVNTPFTVKHHRCETEEDRIANVKAITDGVHELLNDNRMLDATVYIVGRTNENDVTIDCHMVTVNEDTPSQTKFEHSYGGVCVGNSEGSSQLYNVLSEHVGLWGYRHEDEDFDPKILQFGLGSINKSIELYED